MNPDNSQQESQDLQKLQADLESLSNEAVVNKPIQPTPLADNFPQEPLTKPSNSYKSLLMVSVILLLLSSVTLIFYLLKNNFSDSQKQIISPSNLPIISPTSIPTVKPTQESLDKTDVKKISGYIKSISLASEVYTISLDSAEMIEDSSDPAGYYINNPDASVTKYPLKSNVEINTMTLSQRTDGNFQSEKLNISDYYDKYKTNSTLKKTLYWFEILDGEVTKITEQYLP